jgi:hypothetical protein
MSPLLTASLHNDEHSGQLQKLRELRYINEQGAQRIVFAPQCFTIRRPLRPEETKEYFEKKSKVYERLMKSNRAGKIFQKKDKQKIEASTKKAFTGFYVLVNFFVMTFMLPAACNSISAAFKGSVVHLLLHTNCSLYNGYIIQHHYL